MRVLELGHGHCHHYWLTVLPTDTGWAISRLQPSCHYIYRTVVTIRTASGHYMYRQFNIQQLYVLPTQCIYVFCVDLRTNSDYFTVQHWLVGFCNWDGVCLLRGTFYILRSAHTAYLCVLCGSENKQRLFHCTALTGWLAFRPFRKLQKRRLFFVMSVRPSLLLSATKTLLPLDGYSCN